MCIFEIIADIIDSCLLIGVCVEELLEHFVTLCSSRGKDVHVAVQMLHEVGGERILHLELGLIFVTFSMNTKKIYGLIYNDIYIKYRYPWKPFNINPMK